MKRQKVHSKEFTKLLQTASDKRAAIRTITHANPLLVFWVTPDGLILDAHKAHHDNPPLGDRSVLADPKFKGHLRGRVAKIGDKIYVVIYGYETDLLTRYQQALLRKSYARILHAVQLKHPKLDSIEDALFITEQGTDIHV